MPALQSRRLHRQGLAQGAAARPHGHSLAGSYEQVKSDPVLYAHASRVLHLETNPGNARALVQRAWRRPHGTRCVDQSATDSADDTDEMDMVFGLPYARGPHPVLRR